VDKITVYYDILDKEERLELIKTLVDKLMYRCTFEVYSNAMALISRTFYTADEVSIILDTVENKVPARNLVFVTYNKREADRVYGDLFEHIGYFSIDKDEHGRRFAVFTLESWDALMELLDMLNESK